MVKKKGNKINFEQKKDKSARTNKIKTPVIWNPLELMDNINRFFINDPWTSMWQNSQFFNNWPYRFMETDTKISKLDLIDKGDKYKILAEVPGVSKKDLDVQITPNEIRICGETKSEIKDGKEGYIRHELSYSTICRHVKFPEEVIPENAEAKLIDGIIEIEVLKNNQNRIRGRKIPIN